MVAIMMSALPVIYIILPETKGLDLEMIQHLFKKQQNVCQIDMTPSDVEKNDNSPRKGHTNLNKQSRLTNGVTPELN